MHRRQHSLVGERSSRGKCRTRDGKQAHKFLIGPLEFDEAKRQAETWLAQLAGSAVRSVKRSTVREALEAYPADLRRHGAPTPHANLEGRTERTATDRAFRVSHG